MRPTKAGQLRHRITLMQPVVTEDHGEQVFDYVEGDPIWAKVVPISAKETVEAQQKKHVATHQIEIRYRSGLDSRWRVRLRGRVFEIVSILNVEERDVVLQLQCRESTVVSAVPGGDVIVTENGQALIIEG